MSLSEEKIQDIVKSDVSEAVSWRPKFYFETRRDIFERKQKANTQAVLSLTSATRNEHYMNWRTYLLQRKKSNLYQYQATQKTDKYELAEQIRSQFWIYQNEKMIFNPMFFKAKKLFSKATSTNTNTGTFSAKSGELDELSGRRDSEGNLPSTLEADLSSKASSKHSTISESIAFVDHYSFGGMHYIFEHGAGMALVNRVKFANNDASLLAYCASDGAITILNVMKDPEPEVVTTMKGHTKPVTDFDWSISNEYILSVSRDNTIMLWNTATGECKRKVTEKVHPTCVLFHPNNNNMFVVGFANGNFVVYNLSTGLPIMTVKEKNPATSMCFSPAGDILFTGDSSGTVHVFQFPLGLVQKASLSLKKLHFVKISKTAKNITSLSYTNWNTSKGSNPSLLVNSTENCVGLFSVNKTTGQLTLREKFPIAHSSENVKSTFCPLISMRKGACFVSASESAEVCVFDLAKRAARMDICTKLMGHSAAVLDVAWNYDESLLASCDKRGIVVLWKRIDGEKKRQQDLRDEEESQIDEEDRQQLEEMEKQDQDLSEGRTSISSTR